MAHHRQSEADRAVKLAGELLQAAVGLQTPQERRQQAELDRLIAHDEDKATLVEMTDQAFRTHTPARVADQLTHLLDVQGIPRFFSPVEQAMLRGFQSFGEYLPGVAVPLVKEKMRRETANVILPAEREMLAGHLQLRQRHGIEMNVNLLGEALLGEAETERRMRSYLESLRLPDLRCLSVKISTLYSQVSPLARRHTIRVVSDRLEMLYRTALREGQQRAQDSNVRNVEPVAHAAGVRPSAFSVSGSAGSISDMGPPAASALGAGSEPKFIYLDMEEYRDLYLTADVLCETLSREGLEQARAGIALQAYIPDSYDVMRWLIEWSALRVADGGRPLTIRLVKGANLEMERVEASIAGWPQAPYTSKFETDANFKRMLRCLLQAAGRGEIRVGVASHNLFDVALAMIWADELGAGERVQYEMLEGMANHQRRAITEHDVKMLLYAPACYRDEFLYAISYLIRRLDENTGPENFLRHSYRLRVDTPEFDRLANGFRKSLLEMDSVSTEPRRKQDRRVEPEQPPAAEHWSALVNEPDTDWSLPHNAEWIEEVLARWKTRCDDAATSIPLYVGADPVPVDEDMIQTSTDPSRPGVVACRYQKATPEQLQRAVTLAADDADRWRETPVEQRHQTLRQAAQHLRQRRGDLIAAMTADGGKTVTESDPEVSEAIDFTEFYPLTAVDWAHRPTIRLAPRGVVAVITPWNFPLAIPCGGIASALAAGNTVILKPAGETVLPAWLLCQAFWDAGVPRGALQMLPCDDEDAEVGLVRTRLVDAVVLTGGTATARRMLRVRPDLHLLAETGGKNATIVTAMADREMAVKHIMQSAFGHSGQKCSATSLLLLEQEVFDDENFQEMLADAVRSIPVGSAWDLSTRAGPLISPPGRELTRGMKTLEDEESWLVVPEHVVDNPNLYRPGVKWNVRPGSFTYGTELFGPVLGVMKFSRLEAAIEIVRATGYGLTSGLESLDDREIELWRDTIGAGNLYVNRSTTGAVVLRQPFGGVGLSAYGPGSKAGGPHYVLSLCRVRDAQIDAPAGGSNVEAESKVEPKSREQEKSTTPLPCPAERFADWIRAAKAQGNLGPALAGEVLAAAESVRAAVRTEFSQLHDTFGLIGQDNFRRYRPTQGMAIRVQAGDSLRDALIAVLAATAVETQITLSLDPSLRRDELELLESIADVFPGLVGPVEESAEDLAQRVQHGHVKRLRQLQPVRQECPTAQAAAEAFTTIIDQPVVRDGRIEPLRYLDEQSICHDYHRYGNLGRRAGGSVLYPKGV